MKLNIRGIVVEVSSYNLLVEMGEDWDGAEYGVLTFNEGFKAHLAKLDARYRKELSEVMAFDDVAEDRAYDRYNRALVGLLVAYGEAEGLVRQYQG